ncbi:class I SAM-dependent methyltransferase [Agarivorans sp. Z349TD_8]|uniref:class I SAM-dependent methyltransferase n=1 Tax=Agarivorans sp. Z349TD_8 TaxID=3421434 RepID=UPI003D7E72CC
MSEATHNQTLNSNREIHTLLLKNGDYQRSPHFRQENQDKVRNIIMALIKNGAGTKRLIDFGCGTGFIINLTKDLFDEVHGVDITQEMMDEVDISNGNITLTNSIAEATPYPDNSFTFATAYSFMDHLANYEIFLEEVYRVLASNGVFYTDLNPNRMFIQALERAEKKDITHNSIITREIQAGLHNGSHYEKKFGIDPELLAKAEPIKTYKKGFLESEVRHIATKIGFKECHIEYEWYINQGSIFHNNSPEEAEKINQYLTSLLPMSSSLYKYLRIILVK